MSWAATHASLQSYYFGQYLLLLNVGWYTWYHLSAVDGCARTAEAHDRLLVGHHLVAQLEVEGCGGVMYSERQRHGRCLAVVHGVPAGGATPRTSCERPAQLRQGHVSVRAAVQRAPLEAAHVERVEDQLQQAKQTMSEAVGGTFGRRVVIATYGTMPRH